MKNFIKLLKLLIVLGISITAGYFAIAMFAATAVAGEKNFSFITLNSSYHYFDRDLNEKHDGFGLQYKELGYIDFTNSYNNKSELFYWQPNDTYIVGFAKKGYAEPNLLIGLVYHWEIVQVFIAPTIAVVGLRLDF